MATKAGRIIAETLGMDSADIEDYRYQSTRTKQPVYAIGADYYAVSKETPRIPGYPWEPMQDQFWATRSQTVIWQAKGEA